MARVPYEGVPTESPSLEAPNDYQHEEATPESFGAQVGQGLEQAGAGAIKASDFYSQVAANQATNNYLDQTDKLLTGDPAAGPAKDENGNALLSPSGGAVYNGGFFGTRGQGTLNASKEVSEKLDELIAEQREGLSTPLAREQFDIDTRRYRAQALSKIGEFTEQQNKTWLTDTNKTTMELAANGAAANPTDPMALVGYHKMMLDAATNVANFNGIDPAGARLEASQKFTLARINSLLVSNPPMADQVREQNKSLLSSFPDYYELTMKIGRAVRGAELNPAIDANSATQFADAQRLAGSRGAVTLTPGATGQPIPTPVAPKGPIYDQIARIAGQSGGSPDEIAYAQRTAKIESNGNPNAQNGSSTGLFQYHPETFAKAGGTDIHDTGQQVSALLHDARQNAQTLTAAGVEPTGANLYVMHQQGPAGAMALLSAPPETSAIAALTPAYETNGRTLEQAQAIATRAVVGNGGSPTMSAGQFADHVRSYYGGGGGATPSSNGAYPSTADAIRGNELQYEQQDRNYAETKWPLNTDGIQDAYVDGMRNRRKAIVEQQEQQYTVDRDQVYSYTSQHNITTQDEMNNAPPAIQAAFGRMTFESPYAAQALQNRFDRNQDGKAADFGANWKDYFDRATANSNDPNRITNVAQLNAYVGSGPDAPITNTGADALNQLLAARGTPQGEAFVSQARQFLDNIHTEMTFANGNVGRIDPQGEARFSKFAVLALPAIENAYKAGKLSTVLDPNSPDYLGKAAAPFMRTPTEIMRDRLKISSDPYAPDEKLSSDAQKGDYLLKQSVRAGRLTPDEMRQIGIAMGIYPAPPANLFPGVK